MNGKLSNVSAVILLTGSLSTVTTAQMPSPQKNVETSDVCKTALVEVYRLSDVSVAFYKQNKFDEALSPAKKAFDLIKANCQEEKAQRLTMATNVAEIQIKRGRNEEARIIFKENLPLAEAVYGENLPQFSAYLKYLIKFSDGNVSDEEFEQYILKSLEVKKRVFGNESYDAMMDTHRIAVFYDRQKKREKAEDFYLQAISIHDKLPLNEKNKRISVVNSYRVFLIKNLGEEGRRKDAEFMKQRPSDSTASTETSDILNRVISLPKPAYPPAARASRARGTVGVSVTINESGDVIGAKAVSGDTYLQQAAVNAAKAAKFLPTYANGQAVQVTGVIVYNFVP